MLSEKEPRRKGRPRRAVKAPTSDPLTPPTEHASSIASTPHISANYDVSPVARDIAQQYLAELPETYNGRKSKISHPDAIEIIFKAVRLGLQETDACLAAGIDHSTYQRWMVRAQEEPDSAFARFALALKESRAAGKAERLERIAQAGLKDQHWTANAWLLERTDPAQFALKPADSASGPKVVVNIGLLGTTNVKVSVESESLSLPT